MQYARYQKSNSRRLFLCRTSISAISHQQFQANSKDQWVKGRENHKIAPTQSLCNSSFAPRRFLMITCPKQYARYQKSSSRRHFPCRSSISDISHQQFQSNSKAQWVKGRENHKIALRQSLGGLRWAPRLFLMTACHNAPIQYQVFSFRGLSLCRNTKSAIGQYRFSCNFNRPETENHEIGAETEYFASEHGKTAIYSDFIPWALRTIPRNHLLTTFSFAEREISHQPTTFQALSSKFKGQRWWKSENRADIEYLGCGWRISAIKSDCMVQRVHTIRRTHVLGTFSLANHEISHPSTTISSKFKESEQWKSQFRADTKYFVSHRGITTISND